MMKMIIGRVRQMIAKIKVLTVMTTINIMIEMIIMENDNDISNITKCK